MKYLKRIISLLLVCSFPILAEETKDRLEVSGSSINDVELTAILQHYPQLKMLSLAYTPITNLEGLTTLKHMIALDLSGCSELSEESLTILTRLPQLEALFLEQWAQLTDRGFLSIAACRKLKHLDLSWNTSFNSEALASLPSSLKILSLLRCSQLTDLEPLTHLKNLRYLDLSHCHQLNETQLANLIPLKLRHLYLWNWDQLSDNGLELIGQMPALTQLDLSFCPQISDRGLYDLSNLIHLRVISLSSCYRITDSGIAALAQNHPNLESIDLDGCYLLTDAAIEHLITLKMLHHTDVTRCPRMTAQGKEKLSKYLKS